MPHISHTWIYVFWDTEVKPWHTGYSGLYIYTQVSNFKLSKKLRFLCWCGFYAVWDFILISLLLHRRTGPSPPPITLLPSWTLFRLGQEGQIAPRDHWCLDLIWLVLSLFWIKRTRFIRFFGVKSCQVTHTFEYGFAYCTELLQLQKQSLMLTDSSIINKAQGRRTRHGIPREIVVNIAMDVFSPPRAHTAPWEQCESHVVFLAVCLAYIMCLVSMTSSTQMHNRLPYKQTAAYTRSHLGHFPCLLCIFRANRFHRNNR